MSTENNWKLPPNSQVTLPSAGGGRAFKITLAVVLGLVALYVACALAANWAIKQYAGQKIEDHWLANTAFYPLILADFKLMSEQPPFPDQQASFTKNAEPFLRNRISWDGKDETPNVIKSRDLVAELEKAYPRFQGEVAAVGIYSVDARVAEIDAAWIDDLMQFDHLDISSHPSIQTALSGIENKPGFERMSVLTEISAPDLMELKTFATVRFFQLAKIGQARKGLSELHHVAFLMHTVPSLISSVLSAKTLSLEAKLASFAGVTDWKTPDAAHLKAFERVTYGWSALLQASPFHEIPPEFLPYARPEIGLCGAVLENLPGVITTQDLFMPKIPLELNLWPQMELALQTERQYVKICHLDGFLKVLAPASATPELPNSMAAVSSIPFFRRATGLFLLGIAQASLTQVYK